MMSAAESKAAKRPQRQADGSWRYAVEHSSLRRNRDWDYRQPGTYAITLTLADRSGEWLGRLECGEGARASSRVRAGEGARASSVVRAGEGARASSVVRAGAGWYIALTPLGEMVAQLWRELGEMWPGVEMRELQVMPDHLHGILRVTTPQKHPLGQIIGSFKAKTTAAARALSYARACSGAFPPGLLAGESLWSPGLHDRILWNLSRYRNARDYLFSNPDRLAMKRTHPALFKVVRDLVVALPGVGTGHFSAIGNHYLLERPLWQVQVSRRDFAYRRVTRAGRLEIARDERGEPLVERMTRSYERTSSCAKAAAAQGDVIISPCVSDGERQIAREALAAQTPLVTLQNKGFAKLQKPTGHYFEACAAGRLLLLAPAAWPYQPGHKPMSRVDATAMNRLCQWIVGEDAAKINYHGMTPANVDALACAAAKVEGLKG